MKRKFIIPVLAAVMAVSGITAALNSNKNVDETVQAATADNSYWRQMFTVNGNSQVDFTSNQTLPEYFGAGQKFPNGALLSDKTCLQAGEAYGLGVTVNGVDDVTINYNVPVYIGDNDYYTPIFEYLVTPDTAYTPGTTSSTDTLEFARITFRMTDCGDPDNYVEIIARYSPYNIAQAYVETATPTLQRAGVNNGKLTSEDNAVYGFGTYMIGGFSGAVDSSQAFFYDFDEKATYLTRSGYGSNLYRSDLAIIRDLDSSAGLLFGNDVPFSGFKSKFANISIKISDISKEKSHLIIRSIDGQVLTNKNGVVEDTAGPAVDFNSEYDEKTPLGEVGEFYPFIPCLAYDTIDGGDISLNIVVKNNKGVVVTNGVTDEGFTPSASGVYTLEYSAEDTKGNKSAVVTKTVTVTEKLDELRLVLDEDVAEITSADVGSLVEFPVAEVVGGSGFNELDFKVIFVETGEVVSKKYSFNVAKAGYYSARYDYNDYLGIEKQYKIDFIVNLSAKPVFDKVNVAKNLVAGAKYVLPEIVAKDFASFNGDWREADVITEIKYDGLNGDTPVVTGWEAETEKAIIPAITSGKMYIRYKATALLDKTQVSESEVYEINVYELNPKTDADKYFVCKDIEKDTVLVNGLSYQYVFKPTVNKASLQFINPLSVDKLTASLNFDSYDLSYDAVEIIISDMYNYNQKITLTLKTINDKAYITYYGRNYFVNGSMTGSDVSNYEGKLEFKASQIIINYAGDRITDASSTVAKLDVYDNGDPFEGFDSSKVYLSFRFIGVDETAAQNDNATGIRFTDFCGQPLFSTAGKDVSKPIVTVLKSIENYVPTNTLVTVPEARVIDAFDSDILVRVTVKDPDNNTISNLNGVLADKEYSFKLSKCGKYTIDYKATDKAGNSTTKRLTIFSADIVDPTIQIDGQFKRYAKINSEYAIYQASASDNYDAAEDLTVYVFMFDPDGYIENVGYGDTEHTYTFKKFGKYRLRYFVKDSYGNYCYKEYTVTVTK